MQPHARCRGGRGVDRIQRGHERLQHRRSLALRMDPPRRAQCHERGQRRLQMLRHRQLRAKVDDLWVEPAIESQGRHQLVGNVDLQHLTTGWTDDFVLHARLQHGQGHRVELGAAHPEVAVTLGQDQGERRRASFLDVLLMDRGRGRVADERDVRKLSKHPAQPELAVIERHGVHVPRGEGLAIGVDIEMLDQIGRDGIEAGRRGVRGSVLRLRFDSGEPIVLAEPPSRLFPCGVRGPTRRRLR